MRLTVSILLFFLVQSISGQSITGFWKNIDDEDGKAKSIIEVYEEEGLIYGKVVRLLENATVTHCQKCKGEKKGAPLVGMGIMWDLQYDVENKNKAENGKILDPKKGKVYGCKIELKKDDELNVRGYIKAPLFGRTQTWYRVEAPTQ
jgi:uncharacterized protein (DUF2147 family)